MDYLLKYGLDTDDLEDIEDMYNESLINAINENKYNIDNIIKLLKKYKFDNIDEIIKYKLPIFLYSKSYLERRLKVLEKELGSNYIDIVSNNLELLG